MTDVVEDRGGVQVDLIGSVFLGAEVVVVPAERLDEQFFSLGTRFAGEIMQKFVNHRLRLVVIGDISRHLEASSALRALVHESNRSDHVWFVPGVDTLDSRLKAMA
ncbi:DUF4180 domain-containing protein [Streptomyces xantholiticus]|uniref:DUF4180 domain-containing protein n=1 Tax=Streptomyces xantholiticus TaxID=68285 RepID=UPI00198A39F2|nr:DUF4180 domain-containing protein [Streptomyces xantholiticus]GGW22644.1 hypothetical protein GCM10010381_00780 [Streptomyces xantholiticus]